MNQEQFAQKIDELLQQVPEEMWMPFRNISWYHPQALGYDGIIKEMESLVAQFKKPLEDLIARIKEEEQPKYGHRDYRE